MNNVYICVSSHANFIKCTVFSQSYHISAAGLVMGKLGCRPRGCTIYTLKYIWHIVYGILYSAYNIQYTVYSIQSRRGQERHNTGLSGRGHCHHVGEGYSVQLTEFIGQSTPYRIQSILNSLQNL